MVFKDFSFHPGYDWKEWDVDFLGELGTLMNQELKGQYSELEGGECVLEAVEVNKNGKVELLVSVWIDCERIRITTWERFEKNNYTVLVDVLAKKILISRKGDVYKDAEIKFFSNAKASRTI